MKGKVRWYNKFRGFGLIDSEDKQTVFIHFSNIKDENKTLKENEEVEFEVSKCIKGFQAIDLRRN